MTELRERGTLTIPEAAPRRAATGRAEADAALGELAAHAGEWSRAPAPAVRELIDELLTGLLRHAGEWVAACAEAKALPAGSPLLGEEWLGGPMATGRYLRLLRRSLDDVCAGRRPRLPGRPRAVAGGRVALPVLPVDAFDRVLLPGLRAEAWLRPGVRAAAAAERQAGAYFRGGQPGVSLVLGAGNVSAIPALDLFDRLFVSRRPVLLKLNPVNDYLGPVFERAFARLFSRGLLRLVYGGADVGEYLVTHDLVGDVHVTGSDKTYEAIVFGTGEEGDRRKRERRPRLGKPVSGELGSVTPVVVVPGPWTAGDLRYQAVNIATMLVNNAGCNCIAARVLVTPAGWPGRGALLDEIRSVLAATPPRYAYYPGAAERWERFLTAHPQAERYGERGAGRLPWMLIPDLDPQAEDEIAFTTESFTGVFAEAALPGDSPAGFLAEAVRFCNERLWGSLGASLLVHPRSLREPATAAAVTSAVAELRYGTVAVNHWTGLSFPLGATPWGAYPGHPVDDIQSGVGFVHNAFLLDTGDVEKTVLHGPFRTPFVPAWFATNRAADVIGERFFKANAAPSWGRVPGLLAASLRG